MLAPTAIHSATLEAYLETEYRVHDSPPFTLMVGQFNDGLLAAHKRMNVSCSAFLTACNPFSQRCSDALNDTRQEALANELRQCGLVFVHGIGIHPLGNWPGEKSFLVLGLELESARMLGSGFEQNALIWSAADATPQLILLR